MACHLIHLDYGGYLQATPGPRVALGVEMLRVIPTARPQLEELKLALAESNSTCPLGASLTYIISPICLSAVSQRLPACVVCTESIASNNCLFAPTNASICYETQDRELLMCSLAQVICTNNAYSSVTLVCITFVQPYMNGTGGIYAITVPLVLRQCV